MTRFLIMLTCLFASATLSAALALFTGWPVALLAGGHGLPFHSACHGSFRPAPRQAGRGARVRGARRMSLEFEQSLNATRHRMDEISTRFETQSDAQGRKIVSELRMLEGLMREFAGKVSRSARAQQSEIAPRQVMQTGRRQGSAAQYLNSLGEGDLLETIRCQPGRKPRRSLSAAHRQPAAAQAALL